MCAAIRGERGGLRRRRVCRHAPRRFPRRRPEPPRSVPSRPVPSRPVAPLAVPGVLVVGVCPHVAVPDRCCPGRGRSQRHGGGVVLWCLFAERRWPLPTGCVTRRGTWGLPCRVAGSAGWCAALGASRPLVSVEVRWSWRSWAFGGSLFLSPASRARLEDGSRLGRGWVCALLVCRDSILRGGGEAGVGGSLVCLDLFFLARRAPTLDYRRQCRFSLAVW